MLKRGRMPGYKSNEEGLTAKQAEFVQQYQLDHNPAQAAIRAGYSKKAAAVAASRIMTKPAVARAIKRDDAERAARMNITASRALIHTAQIAFANIDDARVRTGDKLKALEMILKVTGAYDDKLKVEHTVSREPPVIEIVTQSEPLVREVEDSNAAAD